MFFGDNFLQEITTTHLLYSMESSELAENDVIRCKNDLSLFEEIFNETPGGDLKVANSARSRDV